MIVALFVLFLPIKVHYSFKATALVYPTKEWFLKRGQDDSFVSELRNIETSAVSKIKSYKFERGDIAEVQMREGLTSNDYITAGDTIAYIHSYEIENDLVQLRSEKEVELAALRANMVGEKQQFIDQAMEEIEYAKQQLALESNNFDRQKKLYKDSVISQAEFELYENSYKLAEINVQLANSKLQTIESGSKKEEIDYILEKVNAYDREIETLETLKSQYYITSPINGIVSYKNEIDGIITILDTSRFILKIPIKVHNIQFLDRISGIRFSIPGLSEEIQASYIDIDENVSLLSNQQLMVAKAFINARFTKIYPGMAVHCEVICDEITIFEFLKRNLKLRF
ncbi:MAG: hypothetical protein R2764_06430 [Bacteroidales bacterium]